MSSRKGVEEVETFVLLPYADFKSMDQRVKRAEEESSKKTEEIPGLEEKEDLDKFEATMSEKQAIPAKKKKDLAKSYRKTHLKKLIQQMPKTEDANEVLKLDNLDSLIDLALGNSKRSLPNEEIFFQFAFQNGLSKFIKNRFKINLYFEGKDNWYKI